MRVRVRTQYAASLPDGRAAGGARERLPEVSVTGDARHEKIDVEGLQHEGNALVMGPLKHRGGLR
jgi:hypothetical protein